LLNPLNPKSKCLNILLFYKYFRVFRLNFNQCKQYSFKQENMMTFDFPSPNGDNSEAEACEDTPFTEEEWDAINALSEPGAIF